MAVQNTLAPKKDAKNKNEIVFIANGSQVTLTPETVKNYLVSGDKDRVTMQEVVMFMNLCKFNGLNPWLKEAYLIKYGSEPATIVAGKEAFMKRAEGNAEFNGYEAGIILLNTEGELVYRKGSFKLPNETLVGGYAEVFRKDREHSYREEVTLDDYIGKKKDGGATKIWREKPSTMIRKVALVHALREAFPGTIGGMYSAEEQGVDEPIDVQYTDMPQEKDPQQDRQPGQSDEQYTQQSFTQPQTSAADALFGN